MTNTIMANIGKVNLWLRRDAGGRHLETHFGTMVSRDDFRVESAVRLLAVLAESLNRSCKHSLIVVPLVLTVSYSPGVPM